MDSQTATRAAEAIAAREADAQRFCRVVTQVAHASFAGLARADRTTERLYCAEHPAIYIERPGITSLFSEETAPLILSGSDASEFLGGHPWTDEVLQFHWVLLHPVPFSDKVPPAVICAAGMGDAPPADTLDDLGGMLKRSLRQFTELTMRRDDSTRYRLLARATRDIIWDWDIATGQLDYNENLERILGIDRRELQADPMRWFSYVHPDDHDRIYDATVHALEGSAETLDAEYRLRRRDGTFVRVLEKSYIARDEEGHPVRMLGSITDITAARHAEAELNQARHDLESALRRLRQIMDESTDVIVTFDGDARLLEVSSAADRLWGYGSEECRGLTIPELVHPDDMEQCHCAFELLKETGTLRNFAIRFIHRDGHAVHMEWSCVWSNDQQLGFSIGRDVTDQVVSLRRLSESEEQYRLVFVENPVPMTMYDENSLQYVDANPAALKLYGLSRDEFLHRNVIDVVVPEEREQVRQRLVARRGGGPRSAEWHHINNEGRRLTVQGWSHPLSIQGRDVRIVVALDVSDQRELEAQLRQAQKMEAVGQLAGGIAHDFNNLLTIINGYATLLRQRSSHDDAIVDYVDAIEEAGKRATVLTQQLLAFSRKQVLQPKIIDLNASLLTSEPILRRLVRENIDLKLSLAADLERVHADAAQIEQVLMNLVVNARDAMPEGGKLLIETCNVTLDQRYAVSQPEVSPGCYVLLAVTDTGVGMDASVKAHIFEPFFTTKAPHAGYGLGLPTVYGIVKQSGGHIWVYSEPGRGTTMKVFFPAATPTGNAPVEQEAPRPRTVTGGTETILLVEDDDGVRAFTSSVLAALGYKVLAACDGKEALAISETYKDEIHLLLTDVILPRIGGRALADMLMPLRPSMRSLFVSGYTENAIVHHGVLDPGINYLAKPFDPAQLAQKVRQILDAPARPRRVLVVDDEPALRQMFSTILAASGYDTCEAEGPEDAVQRFKPTPVDLILTDLRIPGFTEEDTVRTLRSEFPHARIVCITGAATELADKDVARWGGERLLLKPVPPSKLVEIVKSLIG